ncbi:RDD family protein [Microbacterium pseudoresistens]|uniref:Putative RDD family membrane protein YckC n=1 Tax=Microbacterium pseudoresistens TaxID=640634 RepID=A0A7Y9EW00_9MICO|nr:RDD family protein [Microbacterium pseudoresistens]NYD54974.1 putative RDD family membrane protein YckC [Microbacterium pseudoresistens]
MSDPATADDEVLSGEAVAIDVQPVGFFLRVLGAAIDVVACVLVFIAFLMLRLWLVSAVGYDDAIDRILLVVSIVISFVVLPCAVEVLSHGRSLGRLAVGGRIVRLDGGAAGFRHAFIRAVVGMLEIYSTLGGGAILAGAFSARSQRLGDMIAGTYAQKVRTPRLVPHAPVLPPMLTGWAAIADVARMPDRLARRISQFLQTADRMLPAARARIAHDLVAEASAFISPLPAAPDEAVLHAAMALRRERETRALLLSDDRAERLTGTRIGL